MRHPKTCTTPNDPARIELLNQERKRFGQCIRLSKITERGYAYDWSLFDRWCARERRVSLPATADTVAMYITEILVDGKKISTAQRRWSAILHSHRTAALPAPALEEPRAILNGAQHIRLEQPKQMAPLSIASLEKIAARLSNKTDAASARDRAIMVIGFASALRRSTLTALLLSDIEFTSDGLIVNVRKEKQDQKGKGRLIGLPHGEKKITCPVASVRSWLHHRGERAGPLFTRLDRAAPGKRLHPGAIAGVVKSCVSKIGLDPRKYAGHSLRAGFITEAGEAGIGELIIAAQTGHRSMEVLRRYFRRTELFKANAAGMIGL